jgi:hypothetical protein
LTLGAAHTGSPVDWSRLKPNRHLDFLPGAYGVGGMATRLDAYAAALGPPGPAPAVPPGPPPHVVFPFNSVHDPGLAPGVYLADLTARTVLQLPALGPETTPVAVSGTGQVLGVSDHGSIGVLDLQSRLIQVYPQLSHAAVDSVSVDAYGNIAYTDDVGRVHLLNAVTGQDYIVPTAGRGLGPVHDLALSGDGRFLSYTARDATGLNAYTNDLATGAQLSPAFLGGVAAPVGGLLGGPAGALGLAVGAASMLYTDAGLVRAYDAPTGMVDNLAALNTGAPVFDPAFVMGDASKIGYTQNGKFLIYDRRTGLIDTLPYVNQNLL